MARRNRAAPFLWLVEAAAGLHLSEPDGAGRLGALVTAAGGAAAIAVVAAKSAVAAIAVIVAGIAVEIVAGIAAAIALT